MTRTYTRIHGNLWGLPGIYYRSQDRYANKPFYVKYARDGKTVHIGSYLNLRQATAAAKAFLTNEATPLCPPPSPAPATPIAKSSSTER